MKLKPAVLGVLYPEPGEAVPWYTGGDHLLKAVDESYLQRAGQLRRLLRSEANHP
jgi:hypothetical protein